MEKTILETKTNTRHKFLIAANAWLLISIVFMGCGPSDVPGEIRSTEFEPTFGAIEKEQVVNNNNVDTSFLGNGSFACVVADIARLKRNEALADVPWQAISNQLAPLVGNSNSDLAKVRRVWLVLDRGAIAGIMTSGGNGADNPSLFVIDYKDPYDSKELQQAIDQRSQSANAKMPVEEDNGPQADISADTQSAQIVAQAINDKRILIGPPSVVESTLKTLGGRSDLAEHVSQLQFANDFEGALTLGPIQELITQMTSTLARFGGPEMEKWKRLPNSIQATTVVISLTGEETISVTVEMDDQELVDAIIELAESNTGGGPAGMIPGLGAIGGLGNGRGPDGGRETMLTPTAIEPSKVVAESIKEGNLFSITKAQTNIYMKLQRPEGLTEMVKALVVDSSNTFLLAERQRKLNSVLGAMRQYEAEHGCLPPAGIVNSDDSGLPLQFNWRTGLLKYIDSERYDQFDFSKPWDDPANLKIAASIPDAFSMTSDTPEKQGTEQGTPKTRFQIVGGDRGFYEACLEKETQQPKIELIKDTKKYTAIVVESKLDQATAWTSPEGTILGSNDLGNENENGVMFISGDWKVRVIRREPAKIAAILTADGGEKVTRDDLVSTGGR